MTARKHLKQLVRERMRKTGEAYTVARRHVADPDPSWEFRGGIDGDAAAFANVLAHLGVVAPHTGEPLTEAMILGVGGGLGAGYILWELPAHPVRSRVLTLGFRRLWQYPDGWARQAAERLGLRAELHETGSAKVAAETLDAQLDQGLPAIAWVDPYTLGHRGLPEWFDGYGGPPVIVYERTGDSYAIDDRSTCRVTVSGLRLASARARVGSYRHRLITIDRERVDVDLRPAVEEGLRLQVDHLSERSDSFSLPAWRKWARMTTDTRNTKGWPTVFADGLGVGSLRASVYTDAGHGRHLRGLYADFLDEAADLVGRDTLRDAADAWRTAASHWESVVDEALAPGDELRELIDRGDAGRWELQARRDEAPGELPALGEPVAAMYDAEVAALTRLRSSIG